MGISSATRTSSVCGAPIPTRCASYTPCDWSIRSTNGQPPPSDWSIRSTNGQPPKHSADRPLVMLLNQLLFAVLMLEALLCLLLAIPYGHSFCQKVVQFMFHRFWGPQSLLTTICHGFFLLMVTLFISNCHTNWKYKQADTILSDGLRIRLLEAQRDMYISGFSLFLFLMLRLVYAGMIEALKMEKSLEAMQKQAQGAAKGYKAMLEQQELAQTQLDEWKALLDKKDVDPVESLLEQVTALKIDLKQALEAKVQAQKQLDQVKMQATKSQDAYLHLLEEKGAPAQDSSVWEKRLSALKEQMKDLKAENSSLKEQLKDFDYVFADQKKKDL